MKTSFQLSTLALISTLLIACDNPADNTADATISDTKSIATGSGGSYTLTDESTIEFTGSKVTGSHDGGFKSFSGSFTVAEGESVPNSGSFTIDMDSTWSDAEKLTGHLKSPDFFDVAKFPTSTFALTSAEDKGAGKYEISGNFNLHGVEKNITFPATAQKSAGSISINAEFDIDRKAFGIVYPGRTDDLIRDEVIIRLSLKAKAE